MALGLRAFGLASTRFQRAGYSCFGFASLLFPTALLIIGWNRFWAKELEYAHTKLIGFIVLALAVPAIFDLTIGKSWIRGSLIPAGGYLGQEINRAATSNLNASGAAIVLITAALVGILLATRISLAAIFLMIQQQLVSAGRTLSMHWARVTERRRKEKMKETVLRKHLEKEAPALRLVTEHAAPGAGSTIAGGPVVREVKGRGHFKIRKVTKAYLRKAAESISENPDPFEI